MTRRRWIADEVSADRAFLTGDHADHLIRVLRVRVGQEFDIVAAGVVRRGKVANIGDRKVEFDLGEEVLSAPAANVTLLLAIFKFDRMDWAIEKCTELGVSKIVPVIARRTETHLAQAAAKRVERWRRVALQAAEQSRRTGPPEISDPIKLKDAAVLTGASRIVLSESEQGTRIQDLIKADQNAETLLAIGPEGGWAQDELELLGRAGWVSATLGESILRTETAAIAATVLATTLSSE